MARSKLPRHHTFLIIIAAVLLSVMAFLFVYRFNDQFQEFVDDAYYATYYTFSVDPTINTVADSNRNVAYCDTTSNFQKLDVYTPKRSDSPRPVVIYIHGGGWSTGDKSNPFVVEYGPEIVKNDLAFISINYRLAPRIVFPAQNEDVNCALSYIKTHAQELNVDASKIALLGDSAGGQLAAMAALTSPDRGRVRAVAEFYSPSDIWAQITRIPKPDQWAINYIGSTTDEATAQQASPLYQPLAGAPPFLLIHGTDDQTVHYDQSAYFAAKLKAAKVNVTLVSVQHANHYVGAKSSPTSKQVKTQTVEFFKQYLE